ncbi:hypothetical protein FOHLNKBM_6328 [Methylobacterium longum]|nr:hypothetical protein FOHLNKBM_6328 [Methylobacterium longum]
MSARGSISAWNFSDEPSERPPETMIRAAASSGRSDWAISSPLKRAPPAAGTAADTGSIGAGAPPSAAALNAAVRTVITVLPAGVWTVWIALPA